MWSVEHGGGPGLVTMVEAHALAVARSNKGQAEKPPYHQLDNKHCAVLHADDLAPTQRASSRVRQLVGMKWGQPKRCCSSSAIYTLTYPGASALCPGLTLAV